jgi:hypothetical protein
VGRVAEQVAVERPADDVLAVLLPGAEVWLQLLLRLAGDEGEAAAARLVPVDVTGPGARDHRLRLDADVAGSPGRSLLFDWSTTGYRYLFQDFVGTITVRPDRSWSILALEGTTISSPGGERGRLSRVAAESAARRLVGLVRDAVEAGDLVGASDVAAPR